MSKTTLLYRLTPELTVAVEAEDRMDCIRDLKWWYTIKKNNTCGHCKSKNIIPWHRITQKGGFEYFELLCKDCFHTLKIHQKQETREYYIDKNDRWVKYEKDAEGKDKQPESTQPDDDIPF